jgi:hypothetical protein
MPATTRTAQVTGQQPTVNAAIPHFARRWLQLSTDYIHPLPSWTCALEARFNLATSKLGRIGPALTLDYLGGDASTGTKCVPFSTAGRQR